MDLQVANDLPETLSKALSDRIREMLMKTGKYVIIDRGNTEVIMAEIARGQTGCYDEKCAVQVGRLLSAHFIVTGAVVKLGPNECQVSAQLTDVARAEIIQAASDRCSCDGTALVGAAENVALDLAGISRQPGKIVIQSTPSGGLVYIDGERAGQTPFNAEVKPGRHKVMVTARGYKLEEQTVTIAPGASTSLNFSLQKEKKKWYQTWWFYTAAGVAVAGGIAGAFAAGGSRGGGGGGETTGGIHVTW